ncbi:putative Protein export chaperone SecB [Syntrophobacter sp. SbD1]|nr:putative Protein export chaperone SecB [Syntrophobacter sp. SbD1]
MPVQLKIQDIRVLRIDYSIIQGDSSKADAIAAAAEKAGQSVNIALNFKSEDVKANDQSMLKNTLGATIRADNLPFTLSLDIGGIFLIEGEASPEELDKVRHINCNAILFPYLRELVSEICRRGGMAALYLTPVNFVQLYNDGAFKQEKQD